MTTFSVGYYPVNNFYFSVNAANLFFYSHAKLNIMKGALRISVAAAVLLVSGRCVAQTTTTANCSVTIVAISETDRGTGGGAGKAGTGGNGHEIATVTRLTSKCNGVSVPPVVIKGDFIKLSLLGKKRRNSEKSGKSISY